LTIQTTECQVEGIHVKKYRPFDADTIPYSDAQVAFSWFLILYSGI